MTATLLLPLIDFLEKKKIEIPSYHTFTQVITNILRNSEKSLAKSVNKEVSEEVSNLLDDLFEFTNNYKFRREIKLKRYNLTFLKKSNQSIRPSKIKDNILNFKYLEKLFQKIKPLLNKFKLSLELIEYYA